MASHVFWTTRPGIRDLILGTAASSKWVLGLLLGILLVMLARRFVRTRRDTAGVCDQPLAAFRVVFS